MERDSGNLFALEGVLIALILLGAAYAVRPMQDSSLDAVRPRTELGRLASDVLIVLDGLDDGNGTTLLDLYMAESFHCAFDATPAPTDCDGARSKNLSVKLEGYLPLGAGYAIELDNGIGSRELYRSPQPRGESVAAAFGYAPEWNVTFLVTELSCYDPGTDINVTMVPIDRSASRWTRWGNVTVGSAETAGERAIWPRGWNATLAGATRPATGTILANVTGNATLEGATTYGSCAIGARFDDIVTALRATPFAPSATIVPLGTPVSFDADLTQLLAVPGVSVDAVNVSIFDPLPARNGTPDSWIAAGRIALTGGAARTGSWTPDEATLYGLHPALLRVGITIAGTQVELRRVATLDIALPTGQVPIDPPYRASLHAWLPDWG